LVVNPYVIRLSHTAYECSRLRYSVSREAPEEEYEGNDRRRRPAPQGLSAPRSSLTSRVGPRDTNERGTGQQLPTSLKKWLSWLKVNLLRFAIKQIRHQRGTGILPRGTWPRDYTKDNKVGYATLAVLCTLVRLIPFGIDCNNFTWSLCSSANQNLSV
jgi:hypothetical protein